MEPPNKSARENLSLTLSMHRFYISPGDWNPDALVLNGSEVHHCRDVLRMQRGDKAVLFNGCGREITAEIVDLERGAVHLRKLHESNTPPLRCRAEACAPWPN